MKTRNRTILNVIVFLTIMALTGQAGAGIQPRLEGSLSQPDAMVVTTRTSTTVAIERAVVHLESGALRLVQGGSEGGFLQIEAVGLNPESRYMVLTEQTPIYAFSGDSNGRYSARITDRIQIEGSVMVRHSGKPFAFGLTRLQVIDLDSGLVGIAGPEHSKTDQAGTTPLCGNDPQSSGQATATVQGDFQMFTVEGWGLAPLTELTVIADGIPIGPAVVDDRGYLLFVAGNAPGTGVPLPPELGSVADIDEVLVVTPDQAPILFGSFDNPCDDGGGGGDDPVDSGSISICGDANMMIGSMDWVVFADGLQVAAISAFELPSNAMIGVAFDATLMGSAPAGPRGDFFVTFSSDPFGGELPFPPNTPPLDQVQTVDLTAGDVIVGSGTFGEDCEWIDPPEPVDEDFTNLCPVDPESFAAGETGWLTWDDGSEDFFVGVYELQPSSTWTLIVDGHNLGAFTASNWGEINLWFSSNPNGGHDGNPGMEVLPLPDEIRPVSSIDSVSLVSPDGAPIVAGSFVDGCDDIPEPPMPVEESYTDLCPVNPGTSASGMTGWTVWGDGTETFFVDVFGLGPNSTLNLIVDGHDLGAFTASDWGDLNLYFSSNPGGDVLYLPVEIQPVSSIDSVSLFSPDGAPIVAGSFVDGCDDIPDPPMPVDEGYTNLCPVNPNSFATGQTGWIVWEDGSEDFFVGVFELEPFSTWNLIVDGHDLGAFTTSDWGGIQLWFSSDPTGAHGNRPGMDVLELPDEIRPVSSIDLVSLVSPDGAPIVAGSFVDGCDDIPEPPMPIDEDFTDLCPAIEGLAAGNVGWIMWEDGTEQLMVTAFPLEPNAAYQIIVDGFDLGFFEAFEDGSLWVDLSSNPTFDGQFQLPEGVQPVSNIDVVEIRDAQGATIVTGSFSEPCSMEWIFESDATGLCDGAGLHGGDSLWWIGTLNGTVIEESLAVIFWAVEDGMTYSVEVDGFNVGEMIPLGRWDGLVFVLNLGDYGDAPIPDELRPISGIDVIQILDGNGQIVVSGSYENPCGGDNPAGDGDGPKGLAGGHSAD